MLVLDLPHMPRVSEQAAFGLLDKGVSAAVMRLPQVHNTERQGFVSLVIRLAKEKGMSAHVEGQTNRWAAVHVDDAARAYRLAFEHHQPGLRHHAVSEEGLSRKEIADAIGKGLKVPVQALSADAAAAHFGWLSPFVNMDSIGSSAITKRRLGWNPVGPGLIEDLAAMDYSAI